MREFLTLTEAGARLGVSRHQIKKYIDQGRIKAVPLAGRLCVDAAALKKPKPRRPGRPRLDAVEKKP